MNKYYYKVYGLILESEICIPELLSVEPGNYNNSVYIKYSNMPQRIKNEVNEKRKFNFDKKESWFLIDNIAIFRVCNGNEITIESLGGSKEKIKAFILGSSLGCILIQRNIPAIHGGTIISNDKAIIITGDMGAGKSTLTSSLRMNGYKFLSDDVSAINLYDDYAVVKAAYPQQKLCRDCVIRLGLNIDELKPIEDGRDKFAVLCKDQFEEDDKVLHSVFYIDVNEEIQDINIHEIKGIEKVKLLIKNIYRIDIAAEMGLEGEYFNNIIKTAKHIKFYRIERPKDILCIDEEVELVKSKISLI